MNDSVSYQMQCEVDYAKQQGIITSKTVLLLVLKTKYIHTFKRKKKLRKRPIVTGKRNPANPRIKLRSTSLEGRTLNYCVM